MFWVITPSRIPRSSSAGQGPVGAVGLLVLERGEALAVEAPEAHGVPRKASMCATSIGFTFSHSPVRGVRKSGIPDGTEMPAPVSATTEPAPSISSASAGARFDEDAERHGHSAPP
jgi:hypothetical protein